MRVVAGALLVLLGAAALGYVAAGAAMLQREPPLLAVGIGLLAVGGGVWGRSRVAGLVTRAVLGAIALGLGAVVLARYLAAGSLRRDGDLVLAAHLLELAMV